MSMDNSSGINAGTPFNVATINGRLPGIFVAWTHKPEKVDAVGPLGNSTPIYAQCPAAIVQIPSKRMCMVCSAEHLFFPHLQPEDQATDQTR